MPIVTPAQEGQAGVETWHGYTRALRWGESEGVHMPQRIPYAPVGPRRPSRKADQRERAAFYNRNRWKRLRAAHLAANPICESCLEAGKVTEATIVHHVKERLDAPHLAYDQDNLKSICDFHHTQLHSRSRSGKP
jgi:5-methylcytosine-specific restriction endonuclease McrA